MQKKNQPKDEVNGKAVADSAFPRSRNPFERFVAALAGVAKPEVDEIEKVRPKRTRRAT